MTRGDRELVGSTLLIGLVLAAGAQRAAALNNPNQFCTGNPCVISNPKDVDDGAVLDFGARTVILQNTLNMLPLASGAIGSFTLKAGSFSITGSGQIKGFSSSAAGGSATIDVVNSIQINDTVGTGAVRLSGQDGGTLTLKTAMGSVTVAGRLNLLGDGLLATGGTLTVNSGANITLSGELDLDGGLQGGGGEFDLTSVGDIVVSGALDLTGGDGGGGFIDITAGGSLTFGAVDMSGSGDSGDGGLATIDVGGNVRFGDVYRGRGADNGENCGDGADVDVTAGGTITIAADMDIRGRGLDCSGGCFTLDGASVFLQSTLMMSGTGTGSDGGDLDVSATTLIRLTGSVQADGGDGGGGSVLFVSDKDVEVLGSIDATGRAPTSPGAALAEFDAGKLTVSGTIDASAGSNAVEGSSVLLAACDVITNPSAVITSLGNHGAITAKASDTMKLRGHFNAVANGGNTLRYSQKANPPDTAGAFFSPLPTRILDTTIVPCRLCDTNADCADTNPCTDDICSNFTACLHNVRNSGPCEDGDLCTGPDTCVSGTCVSGPPNTCDDHNVCTADSCSSALGCRNLPIGGSCDDGDACTTGDACSGGVCVGTPMNCVDGNPCTDDVCSGGVCSHPFNTAPCGSGNPCTSNDACSGGVCVSGPPNDCNDHDVCTADSCDPATGCHHTPISGCVDSDHDQKTDDTDECTTRVWTPEPTTPPNQNPIKFGLNLNHLSGPDGAQRVLIKGMFNVAPSQPLTIDPTANGLHIYAEDAVGPLFSVSLPGGAGCAPTDGWTTIGVGFHKTWRYHNHTGALPPGCAAGSAHGVASVLIKDNRLSSKASLQFKIQARDATLLRKPASPFTRLQVSIALAAQPAPGVASPQAKAGQCAEALFTGNPISTTSKPYCKPKLKHAVIDGATCKGK